MSADATRLYPFGCTSAFCGKGACPEHCVGLPELAEFERWRDAHGAVQSDPIWCPRVWTGTREAKP